MSENDVFRFKLHLDTIEDLFTDPETNPLVNPHLRVSGIQTLLNELETKKAGLQVHLNIFLPADQITPKLEEQVKDAIRRYCDFQIELLEIETGKTRYDGRRAFRIGLVGMAIFLFLSAISYAFYYNAENKVLAGLAAVLGTFFSVASWVIIWGPVDTLVYGWRPMRRQATRYRSIANAQVSIHVEPG